MSIRCDEVRADILLLRGGGAAYAAPVRVEHERGTDDISSIVELLRLAGVDSQAFVPGARFHVKISYVYAE